MKKNTKKLAPKNKRVQPAVLRVVSPIAIEETSLRSSHPDAGKAVCLLRPLQTSFKIKNPPLSGFPILNGRGGGMRLPVKLLTEFSCRPGSRYSSLPNGKTRTTLRLSNPDATPSSWCCFQAYFPKTKTTLRWFYFGKIGQWLVTVPASKNA